MKFSRINANAYGQGTPAMKSDESAVPGATPGEDLSGLLQPHLSDRRSRDVVETELIDRAYQKYISGHVQNKGRPHRCLRISSCRSATGDVRRSLGLGRQVSHRGPQYWSRLAPDFRNISEGSAATSGIGIPHKGRCPSWRLPLAFRTALRESILSKTATAGMRDSSRTSSFIPEK